MRAHAQVATGITSSLMRHPTTTSDRQISGSNYYLVNVHASNEGYGKTGDFQTPYLLTYQQPYYRGLYQAWLEMSGSGAGGSTITAHQLP